MIRRLSVFLIFVFTSFSAAAQQSSWVQLEAHPTLTAAQDAARKYAAELDNVNGFYLGSDWYGVALGPYTRPDADALRRQLRSSGQIPRDAFVSDGERFGQQFWPIGVGAPIKPQPLPTETADLPVVTIIPDEAPLEPAVVDETLAEARASEAALDRGEREMLQIALKWAGFYNSSIDGAFGRGTRASMSAWQDANGYTNTGVLTTLQRADLLAQYNAVLEGLDMELIRDEATGIAIEIPTGAVEFKAYDSPFARFEEKDGSGVTVLLISQPGDRTRFFGLYEILQTLEIVPTTGDRNRRDSSFEIEGVNDSIHTYVTASLSGGQIKGFALVWPAGDDERRTRVTEIMKASFETLDGVLNPAQAADEQSIDLVSGLAIRKPQLARSGFYVDGSGTVVTAATTVANCERVTLDDSFDADVVFNDGSVAVLRPQSRLAPMGSADIQTALPRIQSQITVGGYPYGGALTLPTLTFGTLADVRGLDGSDSTLRLNMQTEDGDIGGPVFDNGGAVIGMLLPHPATGNQVLPEEVSFAYSAQGILNALSSAGVAAKTTDSMAYMPPETLTSMASDMTVLVSCW
ncbi:trypsin-like peptidase domain-containing protein [Marivivens sp.]|jgi:S1-C subfamily serine protease|uniref:trypsin-like peptidase domain-containing protein n=1 Tax=Marivivens sp. TaxID=1978374 RepID=UPI00201F6A10|nr:trypsin-like peptidase domain-containing protein [Marivivens sp.]MCL7406396.1 trypsin-like peptidase domain-containing protein [Marivivens geojensis]